MAEEVLSKLPITSLRGVRFTCKKWNTISKDRSFTKRYIGEAKAAAKQKNRKEFQVVMMLDYKVYLMSVNLLNPSPSIEPIGRLVSLDDDAAHDGVDISTIFHCDGLLLCVPKDRTRVVVWNPFNGQTRWIFQPRDSYHICSRYALGYEKKKIKYSRRSLKVLRFVVGYDCSLKLRVCKFDIFSLNSNSWKVIDVNPEWMIHYFYCGLSLKGNSYWFAAEKLPDGSLGSHFLICFDFTTESFGPPLLLPFDGRYGDIMSLSSVREEQLAVLFQKSGAPAYTLKIWISSKVGPNGVSWNKVFLAVDMKPLTGFRFLDHAGGFFVDEENKIVVVIDRTRGPSFPTRPNMAYIIGENGYFKTVDLGGLANRDCRPLVCSYVPSSVRIKQAAPPDNQRSIPS
ncbi:hypothetical protein Bca4012_068657 [Brassica carinata]